jgi:hypothetical protein
MDKKELKLYVTPAQEIIEMELEGQLLNASNEKPKWNFGDAPEDDDLDEE